MADDPQIPAPQVGGEPQPATFAIERIYTKDLSLENPGAPQSFQLTEQPQIEVGMRTRGEQIAPDVYEYVLTLTVTATIAGKTSGTVTFQKVRTERAPRSAEASSNEPGIRSSPA